MKPFIKLFTFLTILFWIILNTFWNNSEGTSFWGRIQDEKGNFINWISVEVTTWDWLYLWENCKDVSKNEMLPTNDDLISGVISFSCPLIKNEDYILFIQNKDTVIKRIPFKNTEGFYILWIEQSVNFTFWVYSWNHNISLDSEVYKDIVNYENEKKAYLVSLDEYQDEQKLDNFISKTFYFSCNNKKTPSFIDYVLYNSTWDKIRDWYLIYPSRQIELSFKSDLDKFVLEYNNWWEVTQKLITLDTNDTFYLDNCNSKNSITEDQELDDNDIYLIKQLSENLSKSESDIKNEKISEEISDFINDNKKKDENVDESSIWKNLSKVTLLNINKNSKYLIKINWNIVEVNKDFTLDNNTVKLEIYKDSQLVKTIDTQYQREYVIDMKENVSTILIVAYIIFFLSFLVVVYFIIENLKTNRKKND